MTTTRKLIWAFWIFIGVMLVWEFYNYNTSMTQQAVEHPEQKQFFFIHTNQMLAPAKPEDLHRREAFVQQTAFSFTPNSPSAGSFTCSVTVKNVGGLKATNVQVQVRPYKGIKIGDEDNGSGITKIIDDNDITSQINQWLGFSDLGPGQSATQTVTFLTKPGFIPGRNPDPQILFETERPINKFAPKVGPGGG